MEQLLLYNPNNGAWYELQNHADSTICGNPLVYCNPPKEFALGRDVLASVPEDHRHRVTGEYRRTEGVESYCTSYGIVYEDLMTVSRNVIILAPQEPETESYEKLLTDIVVAQETCDRASIARKLRGIIRANDPDARD